jgi:hypothetical protein
MRHKRNQTTVAKKRRRHRLFTQPWLLLFRSLAQILAMMTCFRRLAPILVLALSLSGGLVAVPVPAEANSSRYIDITNDKGGNVLQMAQRRAKLENSGKQVRIRGYCRSACTMLITMRNACLGPGARIGFHAPRIPNTHIIPPYVDQIMGSYYRNGIRQRWYGGWNRKMDMTVISAREYVQLDPQTRICDSLRAKK